MANKEGFDQKGVPLPDIKNRAKFLKKPAVPKSAKVSGNDEGSWGRNSG